MTDNEYLAYLNTKSFEELQDILANFNRSQNRQRYAVIREVWNQKIKTAPEEYALFTKEIRYKTIPRRIGAAFIDGILIWAANALGIYLVTRVTFDAELVLTVFQYSAHLLWAAIILFPMVKYGKTLGMHFVGVQLFDASENESRPLQRLLREGIFLVPQIITSIFPETLAFSWAIAIFWLQASALAIANPIVVYLDAKHRGLNDMIAKTVILRVKEPI
jgi:uncharacterized RDD family membrane protein YckC